MSVCVERKLQICKNCSYILLSFLTPKYAQDVNLCSFSKRMQIFLFNQYSCVNGVTEM